MNTENWYIAFHAHTLLPLPQFSYMLCSYAASMWGISLGLLFCNKLCLQMHTTNYFNTFIEVAEDCPVTGAQIPPVKGETKSVANLQFDIIQNAPYRYTSDDVLFQVHAAKNNIKGDFEYAREAFFSKGQPCFRASPLTKRYGWGVHSNEEGKLALYPSGSPEYRKRSKMLR